MPRLTRAFVLALSVLPIAALADDVALDVRTGENFILETDGNPSGRVLVLRDQDENFRRELAILERPMSGARFEIELNGSDELVYLAQGAGLWQVSSFVRRGTEWVKRPATEGAGGLGLASALTALPDGRVAVRVQSTASAEPEVLVLDPAAGFAAIDRMPEARVTEGMARAISVVEVETAETAGEEYASGNGLGFAAGLQAGIGIAYRRHLANKWGVQLTGIAFGDLDSVRGVIGTTVMRTLSKAAVARFYALAGASVFYSSRREYNYVCSPVEGREPLPCESIDLGWNSSTSLNIGVGIGMEFTIAKRLGLSLELPFTLRLEGARAYKGVYPVPNAALIYYF